MAKLMSIPSSRIFSRAAALARFSEKIAYFSRRFRGRRMSSLGEVPYSFR